MNVLFLSSEVAPFSKTGGLADVSGALPAALAELGHEVRVVTPRYRQVKDDRIAPTNVSVRLRFPFGYEIGWLHRARLGERHEVLFVDHPGYFDRAGLYGGPEGEYPDSARRFAFFAMAALAAAQATHFVPDVVHLNDWQSALAAVALRRGYRHSALGHAKVLLTIHNLAYQGNFPKQVMDELGLPWDLFTQEGLEFYDRLSFLKAAIAYSDAVTTVSPTYAREIQTPEGGNGLDGLLRERRGVLDGILNGVDYREWNPETDRLLPARYSAADLSGKAHCRAALLERFGMSVSTPGPVFGLVSRLADQKGIDLLLAALPAMLERELSVVVLGNGDPHLEQALLRLREAHPRKLAVKIGFDGALSHLVEAGADFFLMPSRYEPCGLNQLYSLRYGTVPLVRAVGGLEDTVVDLSEEGGTGIKFQDYLPKALMAAVQRALALFAQPDKLLEVRRRGMAADFSWAVSARAYEQLYRRL